MTEQAQIVIQRINRKRVLVPIVGTSPLIVHKFSEKAKRQMLEGMQGVKRLKESKDPQADYEGAFYRLDDGRYGFPALGFKACMVSAARLFGKSVKMTELKQSVFIDGEWSDIDNCHLVEICGEPVMREDIVRVGISGTDLRYRPQFTEWRATLDVTFIESMLSVESLLSLIDAGGMSVGVGEWRVEKGGSSGTFTIDTSEETQVIA